jgi:hypothetical protein
MKSENICVKSSLVNAPRGAFRAWDEKSWFVSVRPCMIWGGQGMCPAEHIQVSVQVFSHGRTSVPRAKGNDKDPTCNTIHVRAIEKVLRLCPCKNSLTSPHCFLVCGGWSCAGTPKTKVLRHQFDAQRPAGPSPEESSPQSPSLSSFRQTTICSLCTGQKGKFSTKGFSEVNTARTFVRTAPEFLEGLSVAFAARPQGNDMF